MADSISNEGRQAAIRVLQVIPRMRPGGVQGLVMEIYRNIDRSKIQFDFAVRSKKIEYYDQEIINMGGRIFCLPWSNGNPLSTVYYGRAFRRILREEGPFAAVHSPNLFSGSVLPIARDADVSLRIAHSHSATLDNSSALRRLWAAYMRRRLLSSATHLLACSQNAGEWLFKTGTQHGTRFMLLPNAIDISAYKPLNADRTVLRRMLGFPEQGPLIGHIGRFDPVKNHQFLLEVFAEFVKLCPAANLMLVGEGPLKPEIEEQVINKNLSDSVRFLGVRSDVPAILNALDLFILPSLSEGLGIVLIEAQAAGLPSLVSDAVPTEADLDLNLLQYKSLAEGSNAWALELHSLLERPRPPWEHRQAVLKRAGYEIKDVVRVLERLYLSYQ